MDVKIYISIFWATMLDFVLLQGCIKKLYTLQATLKKLQCRVTIQKHITSNITELRYKTRHGGETPPAAQLLFKAIPGL